MGALGLTPPQPTRPRSTWRGAGRGRHIVILGAGLAGLSAAYELGKLGYTCTILEARSRPGGRALTVRAGTREEETGGVVQTGSFSEGCYLNAGPARIPHHHDTTLTYCRELGVEIQVFNNQDDAAYYYNDGEGPLANRRIRVREAKTDMRGYVAELLAKSVEQDLLDLPLTLDDKEKLVEFLKRDGGLSPDLFYKGSDRRGYLDEPGAGPDPGVMADPYDLRAIVQSGMGNYFSSEYAFNMQPIMFQMVGGNDRLAYAFAERLRDRIRYNAEVTRLLKTETGVRVAYREVDDTEHELSADACICTLPLPVLKRIPMNLDPAYQKAIGAVAYAKAGKIGLEFKRRFWEEDDEIYGGASRTNMDITQILYPSCNYLGSRGLLVGYYNFAERAERVGACLPEGRLELALEQGSKIHPQYPSEFTGHSFSIAWHKTKYSMGGWASYTAETRKQAYHLLCEPDDSVFLAGDHLSYLSGWMAGAFESAHRAVEGIHARLGDV